MTEAPAPEVASRKVDPESLAIRERPVRAIRFKRGAIIAIATLGSTGLMAVTFMALKPQVFRTVAAGEELSEPSRGGGDALQNLPAHYGAIPKLGPPLPGDLGRPILARQRAMASETGEPGTVASADAERAEADRRASELRNARQSTVIAQTTSATASPAVPRPPQTLPVEERPVIPPQISSSRADQFVSTLDARGDINPHRLTAVPSPYTLAAGSIIAASLITGMNSDLPGLVTAQVTHNVFDSATGRLLLVPQGARLIGQYDSVIAFGQRRALVVWQRLILPDGRSMRIDNAPATDAAGYAGLADRVDFHTWSLLKGVALATLLGVGTELTVEGESDLVRAVREAAQQNGARAGDELVRRNLDVRPTITIRPGAPVRLVVHKDLVFDPPPGRSR